MTLLHEKIIPKSREVKTRCSLAESSKKGFGSKSAVLLVVVVMMQHQRKPYAVCVRFGNYPIKCILVAL
jgi:hypothetical protein